MTEISTVPKTMSCPENDVPDCIQEWHIRGLNYLQVTTKLKQVKGKGLSLMDGGGAYMRKYKGGFFVQYLKTQSRFFESQIV